MSGRKGALARFQNITNGAMTGDITSVATNIEFLDNIGIQLNFTGSPTGSFDVQISADHQEVNGNVTVAGNWVDLVLSPAPAASGSADSIYIDMTQLSAPWLRVKYTFSSGTGTLNSFIVGKMI